MNNGSRGKWLAVWVLFLLSTTMVFGADNAGMTETTDYIVGAASIAGLVFIIAINLLWIIFPAGIAMMTYGYFKRKAEQSQEDNGLKAGVSVFFSIIVGFMAAYFIVGQIGKYAGEQPTLAEGNKYIVSSFLGAMVKRFKTDLESGD